MDQQNQNEQPKKISSKLPMILGGIYGLITLGLIIALLLFSK